MTNSPTLADVSRLAGVSTATASMALRRDPRISETTQKRVFQAAAELQYKPDPMLAALVARRTGKRGRQTFANLAVLVDNRWLMNGKVQSWMESFFEGMKRMGNQLGYHVETLFYPRDLTLGPQADRVLHARGIRGVALFPIPGDNDTVILDWDRYALVVIGHPALPKIPHRVGSDPFAAMSLVCSKLRKRGYRKVGLAHSFSQESELRYEFLGALCKEKHIPENPLKIVPPHLPTTLNQKPFLEWYERYHPECIITVDERLYHWLSEAGFSIPSEVSFAFLNTRSIQIPHASGTALHNDATGENAVELLHNQLLRGETGFPNTPKEMLVYPEWVEGQTLRPVSS